MGRGWVKLTLCCPGLLGVREQRCTSGWLFDYTFCPWSCQSFPFWKNSGIICFFLKANIYIELYIFCFLFFRRDGGGCIKHLASSTLLFF